MISCSRDPSSCLSRICVCILIFTVYINLCMFVSYIADSIWTFIPAHNCQRRFLADNRYPICNDPIYGKACVSNRQVRRSWSHVFWIVGSVDSPCGHSQVSLDEFVKMMYRWPPVSVTPGFGEEVLDGPYWRDKSWWQGVVRICEMWSGPGCFFGLLEMTFFQWDLRRAGGVRMSSLVRGSMSEYVWTWSALGLVGAHNFSWPQDSSYWSWKWGKNPWLYRLKKGWWRRTMWGGGKEYR